MPKPSFKVVITNEGLRNWGATMFKAANAAGIAYESEVKRYPPQDEVAPGTRYVRTGTLGNTAHYEAIGDLESGEKYIIEVGGVDYEPYVMDGTVKWPGWPGKLDKIKLAMVSRFKATLMRSLHKR